MARRSGRKGGKGRSAAQKAHSIANLKAYREGRAKAKAAPDKKAAAAAKSKATRAELKAHDKKMATGNARGKAAATKAAKAKAATAAAKKSESSAKSKATRAALKQHDAKMATGVARGKAAKTKKAKGGTEHYAVALTGRNEAKGPKPPSGIPTPRAPKGGHTEASATKAYVNTGKMPPGFKMDGSGKEGNKVVRATTPTPSEAKKGGTEHEALAARIAKYKDAKDHSPTKDSNLGQLHEDVKKGQLSVAYLEERFRTFKKGR